MNFNTFRTEFKPERSHFDINYQSKMMLIGSCFTENIGKILKTLKFNVNINPFGILYNPVSVAQGLDFIIENKQFNDEDLFFYNEFWHSFYHHGKFSRTDKTEALENINNSINTAFEFILNADFIFITLGTSWVYKLKNNAQTVANCHKLPAKEFNKLLLDETEITKIFIELIKKIRLRNKSLKIIFSVSPVRHLKDGFSDNFLSKAIIRTAIDIIQKSNSEIYYFPAFEIINDDLRDYRFYDTDLVHPNATAVKYIFNFFKDTYFTESTIAISEKINQINQMRSHRIFNPGIKQTKKFILSALNQIRILEKEYEFLNFTEEKKYFESIK